jgi:hypothetical protein
LTRDGKNESSLEAARAPARDQVPLDGHEEGQRGNRYEDARGRDEPPELFAENLRRYLAGQPLLNLVYRARGY